MFKSLIWSLVALLAGGALFWWNIMAEPEVKEVVPCPQLTGRVVAQGEEKYEQARLDSNYYTSKNKYPHAIVYVHSAQDIQNAILWARCNKIPLRIRSGGHNHEGYSTGDGVLVIDVSEMKEIKIDLATKIATIQPGINNSELYSELFKNGLTHVGGTCSSVGLSGLVSSGGMGPLIRKIGLTCDTLLEVEMVDAYGKIITATKDNEHKDLFWAICGGGGGNFGVISALKIKVYPAENVTWFNIGWNWGQPIKQIFAAWQDFFGKDDRAWFSHLDLWAKTFSAQEFKKEPIRIFGMYWGTPKQARELLAPILAIGAPSSVAIEAVDWKKAIELIEETTAVFITNKPEYKSTGAFAMEVLPPEGIDIIEKTLKASNSPLLNVLLFSLGGACAEIAPTASAYFYRDAKFFINYSSQWLQDNDDKKNIIELERLRENLLAYTKGDYIGNPDPELKNYLEDYFGGNVARLMCTKKKYDPNNMFRFEQSIPPATACDCCLGDD